MGGESLVLQREENDELFSKSSVRFFFLNGGVITWFDIRFARAENYMLASVPLKEYRSVVRTNEIATMSWFFSDPQRNSNFPLEPFMGPIF